MNIPTLDSRTEPLGALDRLLSDYFKAQLVQPWPAAPHAPVAEPSSIVTALTGFEESPRNQPATRDTNSRARYTLAASVAILLGTCWYLSSGFQPIDRAAPENPSRGGVLGGAGASKPPALEELKHDNAIKEGKATPRPPMRLP